MVQINGEIYKLSLIKIKIWFVVETNFWHITTSCLMMYELLVTQIIILPIYEFSEVTETL
jgi:hypothetical protein